MAKVTVVNNPVFNLALTGKEASYLLAILQNYRAINSNGETQDECRVRSDMWESLNEALSNG
jgi:hypothetical protein